MKHLDKSLLIIVACLALLAPLAIAQDDGTAPPAEAPTEILGGGDAAPAAEDGASDGAADAPDGETAEGEEGDAAGEADGNDPPPGGLFGNPQVMLLMAGVLILFFVMSSRGRKKREGKHRDMLASLKKGDKVTSIGGICGTVVEVKEDEITVKVDETNNVRMRFARWSIRGVGDTAKTESPDQRK